MMPWVEEPLRESLSQSPETLCADCGLRAPLIGFKHRRCNLCAVTRFKAGQDFCTECHTAIVPRGTLTCEPCLEEIRERMPELGGCSRCGQLCVAPRNGNRCTQCWAFDAGEVL